MQTYDSSIMTNSINELTIAIDASRNRSGGAKAHLLGILRDCDPRQHGISFVHVWSYDALLRELPDVPWLVKHSPTQLKQSLLHQLWWQYRMLPREISRVGCNVLLSTDAGTVCRFTPSVVMSRDMLSFEGKEMERYPLISFARLRLFLLKHMQVRSLRQATGALFLTHYASEVIQRFTGQLNCVRVIPHGIGENFRRKALINRRYVSDKTIRCLYVSNTDMYKHQWHVVRAIANLRRSGYPVRLKLIGGGSGPARALLNKAVEQEDSNAYFVDVLDSVTHDQIPTHLAEADLFIFASSCENMPNTLVEAMASGLPIACSDRGPMPEILQNAGTYFDPEDPDSIAQAIEKLIVDEPFRDSIAKKAEVLADQYSWSKCANETLSYLKQVGSMKND